MANAAVSGRKPVDQDTTFNLTLKGFINVEQAAPVEILLVEDNSENREPQQPDPFKVAGGAAIKSA